MQLPIYKIDVYWWRRKGGGRNESIVWCVLRKNLFFELYLKITVSRAQGNLKGDAKAPSSRMTTPTSALL
jgi:hypothetical protein